MKDRIRQLMEAQHMNQQAFAQFTGIGSASLSSIFTGRTRPTLNHVDAIMEKFPNVNPLWLLQGKGGMFQISGDGSSENSTGNSGAENSTSPGTSTGHNDAQTGDLFSSANMTVQASLFDTATSQPSNSTTGSNVNNSQISHSSKRTVSGIQMSTVPTQGLTHQQLSAMMQQTMQPPTPPRKITEIRIFFDDQTWESFVPKK